MHTDLIAVISDVMTSQKMKLGEENKTGWNTTGIKDGLKKKKVERLN